MKSADALKYLKEKDRETVLLSNIEAVLSWDMETVMPEKAEGERAEEMAYLALKAHDIKKDEKLKEAVYSIDVDSLSTADKALVREWKKEVERAYLVPSTLVEEIALEIGNAHSRWLEGRTKNDWKIFLPSMEKLVSLNKEYASCIGDGSYDTLLDLYEKGMTEEKLDSLFDSLESSIHSIMDRVEGRKIDTSFLRFKYDEKKEEEFCRIVATRMGFDEKRGTIGIVAHPFTSTLGSDDVRISNRFTDESVTDPIFSIVHETGHALYEMHASLNSEIRGTSLARGTSMGIHESQSRFWENMMGHSFPFWEYFYPILKEYMPQLENVSLSDFYPAMNYPEPSAIRVNADELTYSLHIILRYRIEKALFDGSLKAEDVPPVWNDLSSSCIRYSVKSDSEGCLQDSHWAGGSFGYFPSYALGNLYSAQFLDKLYLDCGGKENVDNALREGNFSLITEWQDRNIWRWGAILEPSDLIKKVTGSQLSSSSFVNYLEEKFLGLYL